MSVYYGRSKIADNNWLFKYFKDIHIPSNEWYPIISHLAKQDLIDVHPPETKIDATPPNQIKISLRGMAFINSSEKKIIEVAEKRDKISENKIAALTIKKTELEIEGLKRKVPYAIVGFLAGVIVNFGGIFLGYKLSETKKPNTEIIQVTIDNNLTRNDTIKSKIVDTSLIRLVKQPHPINPK